MIVGHAAHALTWGALRCLPWQTALRVARMIGRVSPPLDGVEEAEHELQRLRGGTCLSRALTISARLPRSEIVFGVRRQEGLMRAHAWVVIEGRPLGESPEAGQPIASVDLANGNR